MKKITSIFLIILTIIFMCGCDAETSNNAKKFSAKEGSQPGIAIIGDCTVEIVGTPRMGSGSSSYQGYQSSRLRMDLKITNNGEQGITYDDLELNIFDDYYGGNMHLYHPYESDEIIPAGSEKTYDLEGEAETYNSNGYFSYDLNVQIIYKGEVITEKMYPAGTEY